MTSYSFLTHSLKSLCVKFKRFTNNFVSSQTSPASWMKSKNVSFKSNCVQSILSLGYIYSKSCQNYVLPPRCRGSASCRGIPSIRQDAITFLIIQMHSLSHHHQTVSRLTFKGNNSVHVATNLNPKKGGDHCGSFPLVIYQLSPDWSSQGQGILRIGPTSPSTQGA